MSAHAGGSHGSLMVAVSCHHCQLGRSRVMASGSTSGRTGRHQVLLARARCTRCREWPARMNPVVTMPSHRRPTFSKFCLWNARKAATFVPKAGRHLHPHVRVTEKSATLGLHASRSSKCIVNHVVLTRPFIMAATVSLTAKLFLLGTWGPPGGSRWSWVTSLLALQWWAHRSLLLLLAHRSHPVTLQLG